MCTSSGWHFFLSAKGMNTETVPWRRANDRSGKRQVGEDLLYAEGIADRNCASKPIGKWPWKTDGTLLRLDILHRWEHATERPDYLPIWHISTDIWLHQILPRVLEKKGSWRCFTPFPENRYLFLSPGHTKVSLVLCNFCDPTPRNISPKTHSDPTGFNSLDPIIFSDWSIRRDAN